MASVFLKLGWKIISFRTGKAALALGLIPALSAIPLASGWMAGDSMPITGPVILQLDWDKAVSEAATRLRSDVKDARCIPIHGMFELKRITRKVVDAIFYVGHGTERGLIVGGKLVSWTHISEIVEDSPAKEHYFAACYSSRMKSNSIRSRMVTFDGLVEARLGILTILGYYCWVHGDLDGMASQLVELVVTMLENREPLYLGVVRYRGIDFDQLTNPPVEYEHLTEPAW